MNAGAAVLGDYAIPGDVGAVESVAARLRSIASDVHAIQGRVVRDGLHGSWSGHAADQFRHALGEVPGEIEKLGASFTMAASVMQTFAGELAECQRRAEWLAEKIEQEQSSQREAERRHERAQTELRAAERQHAGAADPVSQSRAQAAVDRARTSAATARDDAHGHGEEISRRLREAASNRDDYERAVRTCCSGLDTASDLGIKNDAFGPIKHFVGAAAKDVAGFVAAPVHWAEQTWKDGVELSHDHSWKAFRKLLEDAKAPLEVAGVALIVLSIFVAPEAVLPLMVLASRAETLIDGAETVGDLAEAEKGNAAQRREAHSHLAEDGVDLAMDVVGSKGLAKARSALPEAQREWKRVKALRQEITRDQRNYLLEPQKYQWKSAITRMTDERHTLLMRRYSNVIKDAWNDLSTNVTERAVHVMVQREQAHQVALPPA